MKTLLKIILLSLPVIANGQMVIPTGTTFTIAEGTPVVINTTGLTISSGANLSIADNPSIDVPTTISVANAGSFANNSAFDFSQVNLQLDLNGGTQILSGNLVVRDLTLSSQGLKSVTGNLTVANSISFSEGILIPSVSGKITYMGSPENLTGFLDNNNSYVEGAFYNNGSKPKAFPIGVSGLSTPAFLYDATGEVGMQVHSGPISWSVEGNKELLSVNDERYWEVLTDITQVHSRISLSLNGISETFIASDGGLAVAQAPAISDVPENLGSSSATEGLEVISDGEVSKPIVMLAKETKIVLRIHDLITPSGSDDKNNTLTIENIHRFDHNIVTLLDRWGVEVKKWKDFTNYDDPINPNADGFDFTKLSPGSYICIVQYGKGDGTDKVEQQMVTVLKTN
jgi:hypothetical protein